MTNNEPAITNNDQQMIKNEPAVTTNDLKMMNDGQQ